MMVPDRPIRIIRLVTAFVRVRRGGSPSDPPRLRSEIRQAPYHLHRERPCIDLPPLGPHLRSGIRDEGSVPGEWRGSAAGTSISDEWWQSVGAVPNSCSRCDESGSTISGNASTLISDEKVSYDTSFSEKTLTNATSDYNFHTLNTEKSTHLGDGSGSSQPLKPKGTRSLSCADFDYKKLSVSREHSDLPIKSLEVEGAHKVRHGSLEIANSISYASNSVKTSFESLVLKAKEEKSPISLAGILSHLETIGRHLGHGREEDAHEFLRYAIDTLQSVFKICP
ncbi:hypothetical protein Scep_002341 [Stephania cephalantha]|uniref:Uncharacterized protein n=1 Tax=Stephania cephalantha TaxID=152367 RepID=A0AAP0LAU4_9MAGN